VIVSNLALHPEGKLITAGLRAHCPRVPLVQNVALEDAPSAVYAALGN
jgi:hypothetical protein